MEKQKMKYMITSRTHSVIQSKSLLIVPLLAATFIVCFSGGSRGGSRGSVEPLLNKIFYFHGKFSKKIRTIY